MSTCTLNNSDSSTSYTINLDNLSSGTQQKVSNDLSQLFSDLAKGGWSKDDSDESSDCASSSSTSSTQSDTCTQNAVTNDTQNQGHCGGDQSGQSNSGNSNGGSKQSWSGAGNCGWSSNQRSSGSQNKSTCASTTSKSSNTCGSTSKSSDCDTSSSGSLTVSGNSINTGAYTITGSAQSDCSDNDGSLIITDNATGKQIAQIWGDPHVTVNGEQVAEFTDNNLNIDLPDGSRVLMQPTTAVNGVAYLQNATVVKGDQAVTMNGVDGSFRNGVEVSTVLNTATEQQDVYERGATDVQISTDGNMYLNNSDGSRGSLVAREEDGDYEDLDGLGGASSIKTQSKSTSSQFGNWGCGESSTDQSNNTSSWNNSRWNSKGSQSKSTSTCDTTGSTTSANTTPSTSSDDCTAGSTGSTTGTSSSGNCDTSTGDNSSTTTLTVSGDSINTGAYTITGSTSDDGSLTITNNSTGTVVAEIWGDPHVTVNGEQIAEFTGNNLNIDLPDGSRVLIEPTSEENGVAHVQNVTVVKGNEAVTMNGVDGTFQNGVELSTVLDTATEQQEVFENGATDVQIGTDGNMYLNNSDGSRGSLVALQSDGTYEDLDGLNGAPATTTTSQASTSTNGLVGNMSLLSAFASSSLLNAMNGNDDDSEDDKDNQTV